MEVAQVAAEHQIAPLEVMAVVVVAAEAVVVARCLPVLGQLHGQMGYWLPVAPQQRGLRHVHHWQLAP